MERKQLLKENVRLAVVNTLLQVDNDALGAALCHMERERDCYKNAADTNHELWVEAHRQLDKAASLLTALRYAAATGDINRVCKLLSTNEASSNG